MRITCLLCLLLWAAPAWGQFYVDATCTDSYSIERKCRIPPAPYVDDFAVVMADVPATRRDIPALHQPAETECTLRVHACNVSGCTYSNEIISTSITDGSLTPTAPAGLAFSEIGTPD